MPLKCETFAFEGEDYCIRESSAFRTFAYSKAMGEATSDDEKQYELTAEYLQNCVMKNANSTDLRWTLDQIREDVSIKLFQWLIETVKEFNGLDRKDPVAEMAAEEGKNSDATAP